MDINQIIKKIIDLPSKFYELNNVSIYSLLQNTGYFQNYNQVTKKNIFDELCNHPEGIDQWQNWSENKRVDSGWYFKYVSDKEYIVGQYHDDSEKFIFSDLRQAWAFFIKNEIEDIRKS